MSITPSCSNSLIKIIFHESVKHSPIYKRLLTNYYLRINSWPPGPEIKINMKRLTLPLLAIGVCGLLSGCASSFPVGTIYTNLKLPVSATGSAGSSKVGHGECVSYFSLVTKGDASIETAMKNGNITKVSHVDWEVENILGVVGKYKVTVYGE